MGNKDMAVAATIKKRKNINDVVNETIMEFPSISVKCNLGEILAEYGMTGRELSLLTGIRHASISELIHNKKVTINLQHALAIVVALRIDFSELFELYFEDKADSERFWNDSAAYKERGIPDTELEKIKENAIRLEREDELRRSLKRS